MTSLQFSKAKIVFLRTFSLNFNENVDYEEVNHKLEKNGIKLVGECSELHNFSLAEEFLLPEREREKFFRIALNGFSLNFPRFYAQPSSYSILEVEPFLAAYPELGVGILLFNIKLDNFTVDEVLFLEQCFTGHPRKVSHESPEFINSISNPCPIDKIIQSYEECVVKTLVKKQQKRGHYKSRCIEINGVKDAAINNAHDLIADFPCEFYGLTAIDEGWRFVPKEVAQERLSNIWTTREFICVSAFHSSTIVINLLDSTTLNKYTESQGHLRLGFGMELEEYFNFSTSIAGLNHGPLLMLEKSSVHYHKIEEVMRKTDQLDLKNIKTLLSYRLNLSRVLEALAKTKLQEIGTLGQIITGAMKLGDSYKILEERLEGIERSLTIQYNKRMNNMMLVLTVLGIIVAVVGLNIFKP